MSPGRSKAYDALVVVTAGVVLSYVWRLQDLFPILARVQFPMLVSLAGLGLLILYNHLPRLQKDVGNTTARLILLILILVAASVPMSLYPGRSFGFLTNDFIKTIIMVALILAATRTFRQLEFMVGLVVAGGALYCWFIVTRFTVGTGGRLGNLVYYDANDLALWIVCTLPLAVYFITRAGSRLRTRLVVAVAAVLMLLALVKTGSRGGFLGLIAVGLYLLIGYRAIPTQKRILAAGGLVLALLVVAGPQYWELMSTLLNPKADYNWGADPQGIGRMSIWTRGMGYMLDNPITGVGARAFSVAEGTISPRAWQQSVGRGVKWSDAHSSFVQIGAELGVIALIAFVAMLGTAFRQARRVGARVVADSRLGSLGQALGGSIIGYAVSGAFLSQAYGAYIYGILALVIALDRIAAQGGGGEAVRVDGGTGAVAGTAPRRGAWRPNVVVPERSVREPVSMRRRRLGPGPGRAGA